MANLRIRCGAAEMSVTGGAEVLGQEGEHFYDFLKHKMGEDLLAAKRRREAMKRENASAEEDAPHKERTIGAGRIVRQTLDAVTNRIVENTVESAKGRAELRMTVKSTITPEVLRTAIDMKVLDKVLAERAEIDVPLDTGGTVTVVCGYVTETSARFVFKDCWDSAVMNEENTNKGGYFKSAGRRHVLEDILPHIAPEWRAILKPRHLVEVIDGETVEYDDLLWLPSATDVFGPANGRWWADEPDSFRLPIFQRERDRVKECGDDGTYPWWLRSVNATNTAHFCGVNTDGSADSSNAYSSYGFAPGFDI